MIIQKATENDIQSISENNIKMAQETENVTLSSSVAFDAVENLINDPSKGFYLLAKSNDKTIGQLMITYEWSDWRNKTIWWVQSVYVHPSHRKKGIFHTLFKHVKTLAEKNETNHIRLYVHNKNHIAQSVYDSLGMKKTSYLIYETKW